MENSKIFIFFAIFGVLFLLKGDKIFASDPPVNPIPLGDVLEFECKSPITMLTYAYGNSCGSHETNRCKPNDCPPVPIPD